MSFIEAGTVFRDTLSRTFPDPFHSVEEERYIIIGESAQATLLVVAHTDRGEKIRIISVREVTNEERRRMNKDSESTTAATSSVLKEDEMRGEYDFSQMKGGVRGKYAARYREGTNLILLAPDVAAVFPDEKAVNDALRKLIAQNALQSAP